MPPKPKAIYSLNGKTLCTAGNIAQLQSQAKTGKTAAIGAMIAAALAPEKAGKDTFGFSTDLDRTGAVIVIDCEQSRYKAHAVTLTALKRAGLKEHPSRLRVYSLVEQSVHDRREMLAAELERANKEFGGIHSAFLDGIADFCFDPNDPAEAFALVLELMQLASKYQTIIVGVLHENPGTQTGKSRGHLGSHMERKAEANLILCKDADEITEIYGPRCRECSISKGKGPRFRYDDAAGMHIACETAASQKASENKAAMLELVEEVFEDMTAMRNSELIAAIKRVKHVKDNAADNWRKKLLSVGLIRKNQLKLYEKAA